MIRKVAAAACVAGAVGAGIKAALVLRDLSDEEHSFVGPRPLSRETPTKVQSFVNQHGLLIFWRRWLPQKDPKGLVILCHGLGEHSGRYETVAGALNSAGFAVYGLDHQGHGASEGDRAHIKKFDHYIDDVLQLTALAKRQNPSLRRVFLVGHSMPVGGLIAVQTARVAPELWTGVVLSAPALSADPKVATPFMVKAANTISNILPKLALDPLPAEEVCSDPAVVAAYANDPLVYHGGIRARFGSEMLRIMSEVKLGRVDFKLPFLIMHGTDDKLVPPEGSTDFHKNCGTAVADKKLLMYEGLKHELWNEPDERDSVTGINRPLRDAIKWLNNAVVP